MNNAAFFLVYWAGPSAIDKRSLSPWSLIVITLKLTVSKTRQQLLLSIETYPTRKSFPAAVPKATFEPKKW